MNLRLSWIEVVIAVVDHGGVTAAARSLGISQPSASNALARFEEALGAPLFARSGRTVALTALGEALLPAMRGVFDAQRDLVEEIERFRVPEHGQIRLGLSPVVDSQRLVLACRDWTDRHRNVELVLKECDVEDMEERLERGTVDVLVGVGVARRPGRVRVALYEESLHYIPRGGRSAPGTITLAEIASDRLILSVGTCGLRGVTERAFEQAGLALDRYPGQAQTHPVMAEWAELGVGGAILPASKLAGVPAPMVVDEARQPVLMAVEAIWRRDGRFRPHVASFVDHLESVVPVLLRGLDVAEGAVR